MSLPLLVRTRYMMCSIAGETYALVFLTDFADQGK